MRSKEVTKGMEANMLNDACLANSLFDGSLQNRFVNMTSNFMEEDEPLDPMTIGLLRSMAVMKRTKGFPNTV